MAAGHRRRSSIDFAQRKVAGATATALLSLGFGPAVLAHAEIDDAISSALDSVSVPLVMEGAGPGQPVVDISIGGGDAIPVALDTGSQGLVVPIAELPWTDVWNELMHFSFSDLNVAAFPSGFSVGLNVPTTIDFGGGAVIENAPVNALLFSFPFSPIDAQGLAGQGLHVEGILGVGPNAGGSNLITAGLPGDLGKGILIDEPGGRLVFGAQPADVPGFTPIATINGAPFPGSPHNPDNLVVQIGDGAKHNIPVVFDSGGKAGWVPNSILGDSVQTIGGFGTLAPGTTVSVYTPDGVLLYSYDVGSGLGATTSVLPDWLIQSMAGGNSVVLSGNAAFLHAPVYISNADGGAMTFYRATSSAGTDIVEP